MTGNGYHRYRGNTPRWKKLLAVVLVVVILLSLALIYLQSNIIYDETGTPRLWLPEQSTETVLPPAASLVMEEPEPAPPEETVTVELLAAEPILTEEAAQKLLTDAAETDGVILPLKGEDGRVFFRSERAVSYQAKDKTAQAIAQVITNSRQSTARLVCFTDSKAAVMDTSGMALMNTGGYVFYDGNNRCWLDIGKEAARDYVCTLAAEAAQFGFDHLILADVGYPTVGKLDKIHYGESVLEENVTLFLEEFSDALSHYRITFSVEMSAEGILNGGEGGLSLSTAVQYADRILAPVTEESEIEALSDAVSAVDGVFVPILEEPPISYTGSYILHQAG